MIKGDLKMEKPVLVIMAAGMGSRYGGLKQIDPVDEDGHIIIDFSMYDAKQAGFEKVIFIIKRENEADFKAAVGDRIAQYLDVSYAYQELTNIPEGYEVPEGRVKPWGTAHAVLSCIDQVDGPFAVINADDYYGRQAFQLIYDYLSTHQDDDKYRYTMVGYHLGNTVTDNGHVARGICEVNEQQELVAINERTRIEKRDGGIAYSEDDGETWTFMPAETIVSLNMWGFTRSILNEIRDGFPAFMEQGLKENPLKCEYFLPSVVDDLLNKGKAVVNVLTSGDKWYGVTYKADKPVLVEALQRMKDEGLYPQHLWEEA
jgi:NDP-sugar pyrophosphorylase family protein